MEADEIRVSDKTFKRAARKAADEIQKIHRGILVKRFSDVDISTVNLSMQRHIRAMKRSETKSAIALPKASENDGSREPRVNLDMSFQRSEFHFTNSVGIHPERDVASMRVIEQAE